MKSEAPVQNGCGWSSLRGKLLMGRLPITRIVCCLGLILSLGHSANAQNMATRPGVQDGAGRNSDSPNRVGFEKSPNSAVLASENPEADTSKAVAQPSVGTHAAGAQPLSDGMRDAMQR